MAYTDDYYGTGRMTDIPRPEPAAPSNPNPPGLMDYDTWYRQASAGQNWDPNDRENQAQYDQYVYTAQHPGSGGAFGNDSTNYASQGDSTGMRAYRGGQDEDYARVSEAQLQSWEKYKDPSCPPNAPYQAFDGSGCVQKPIESANPAKWGGTGGGGGGGSRGGGGTGGAGGSGPGMGGDYGDWTYGLSKMYGDALKDPKQAAALLLGSGGGSAIQQTIDNIDKQLAGMPAGHPGRAALETQKAKLQSEAPLQIAQGGQNMAIQGLTGFAPTNSNWLLGNRGLDVDIYKANQQYDLGLKGNELGWGNLGLGYANLGENRRQYDTGLDWTKESFGDTMDFNKWKTSGDWAANKYAVDKGSKNSFWNSLGNFGGAIVGAISDIRVKENIAPGRRGLSDLIKLKVYSYNYKPFIDKSRKPTMGIMAQDLEKVAPELVLRDEGGLKGVDTYGLLAMTVNAVKELAEKKEKS